jgi:hypothetical protein
MPLVYGGVVLILLLLALFARGFSRDVGDGRVAGRYSLFPLLQSHTPEELTLTWNGLALRFSRSMTPALRGFEPARAGTDIVFEGDIRLRLSPGADTGGSITFSSTPAPAGTAPPSLVVPFTVAGVLEDPPAGAALAWKRAGRTYLLTLPQAARTDMTAGTITLPLAGPAWSGVLRVEGVAAAARTAAAEVPAQASRLPDEASMPSEDRLQVALAAYADAAYRGWTMSRYLAADARWQLADGSPGFSEDIGVGLLAESIARGTWQQAFPLWSDALALQQRRAPQAALELTTSAYVGGVRDFVKSLDGRTVQQLEQVRAQLERSDNRLLLTPGLVTLLADHSDPDLLQKAGAFLAGRTPSGMDVPTVTGLVEALLDYAQVVRWDDTLVRLLKDAINRRILPAVRATNAGVFLETDSGRSDLQRSVICGTLLLRAGTLIDSSLAGAVGRGLIASGLSLADDKGILPATLVLSGGRISSRSGFLLPESIYPMLPLARFVPSETPLAAQLGPGSWVWTSARLATAAASASAAALVFSYPAGVPYHLVLRGIRPFAQLKLHGIPWHSDPSYFKYSDGWAYDAGSETLFMKVTGKSDREEIDISW